MFIEDYACVCLLHYHAVFENPLPQAWDLIFGICVLSIYVITSPGGLILTPVLSKLCHRQFGQSSSLLLLRKLPLHKPLLGYCWFLHRSTLDHTYACLVITFLIRKSGGWMKFLRPHYCTISTIGSQGVTCDSHDIINAGSQTVVLVTSQNMVSISLVPSARPSTILGCPNPHWYNRCTCYNSE